jgi:hypothetical protein
MSPIPTFYLGTHLPHWIWTVKNVPLFVSQRRLKRQSNYKTATTDWCLDSGGFSELSLFGEWKTSSTRYIRSIQQYEYFIGRLIWAAPQDWMCEPFILKKTGLSVIIHQEKTIDSFVELSSANIKTSIIPILQGFSLTDYLIHIHRYLERDIDLRNYKTVGIGSVCRRQGTLEIAKIFAMVKSLGISLHGFGVKSDGLILSKDNLHSADSMAWSLSARRNPPLQHCQHSHCGNCLIYALRWRERILQIIQEIK